MSNRAKCLLCNSILQLKGSLDVVSCSCGEITVDYLHGVFHANVKEDLSNLIMVDDEGNEIVPMRPSTEEKSEKKEAPSREELLDMLDDMRKHIDNLPPHAAMAPITHSDFSALLLLLSTLLRSS